MKTDARFLMNPWMIRVRPPDRQQENDDGDRVGTMDEQ